MKIRVKPFVHLVMHKRVQAEQRSMHLTCATTPVILHKGAIQDLYKGAQKGTPEIALNGAIQVALTLHLFMQLSMHKSVQYDSVKGDSSLGSTWNCLKSWYSTLSVQLKVHLRVH